MTPTSKDLISRLRGRYPVGPIMENGEPEFGYRDMSGPASVIIPPHIDLEAAKHIEALEAELTKLRAITACTMGVSDDAGKLFVHGDHDSIKAAQALILKPPAIPVADRLPGQLDTDIPWRQVQPDAFCFVLKETTVFNGDAILRTWNAMKAVIETREPIVQKPSNDGWVIALQTLVEMPDGKKELGYTTLDGIGVFTGEKDASQSLSELNLPLGWVVMSVNQLIPGYIMPAVLFDTRAVYAAMDVEGHSRTSSENVADVLNAVVRLLRAP